jgi:hypothetical protein
MALSSSKSSLAHILAATLALGFVFVDASALKSDAATKCSITVTQNGAEIEGTSGADTICIVASNVTVNALDGNDSVIDSGIGNTVSLGPGSDTYTGPKAKVSNVTGDDGNDVITGTPTDDLLDGGEGNDTLNGGKGADQVYGDSGTDSVLGGVGDDLTIGGDGLDVIDGGTGVNVCDYTTNEVRTKTCTYDDSPPTLVSASSSRTTIDVSTSEQVVNFTLEFNEQSGIEVIDIWCGDLDEQEPRRSSEGRVGWQAQDQKFWGDFGFAEWNGDVRHPIIVVPVKFKAGTIPGDYSCRYKAADKIGRGYDGYKTSSFFPSVSVVRSGSWDDAAPQLESFELSKTSFDSTNSETTVVAEFRLTDATSIVAAGVSCSRSGGSGGWSTLGTTWLPSIDNFAHWDGHSHIDGEPDIRVDDWVGTRQDATFTLPMTAPRDAKAGRYLCYVRAQDLFDNHGQYQNQSMEIVVTRVTANEETSPVISSAKLNKDFIDLGPGHVTAVFVVDLSDESKINGVQISCPIASIDTALSNFTIRIDDAYFLVEGNPTYYVPASFTGTVRDLSVQIPVKFTDAVVPGKYECTARADDQYGNFADYLFEVEVIRTAIGLPGWPTAVSFDSTVNRPTEGTLSWNAPSVLGTPVLKDYAIQYSFDRVKWVNISDSVSTSTSSNIKNLTANTNYWVRVRGVNGKVSAGTPGSPWSKPISISTPSAIAPDAPTNLQFTRKSATSVTAKWTPPAYSGGVPVTDYLIQISSNGGSTWQTVTHPVTTKTTMILSTLTSGRTYQIKVSAVNSVGTSLACEGVYAN